MERVFDSGRQLKLISVRKNVFSWKNTKAGGRKAFLKHIKDNKLENELIADLESKAKSDSVALPPEITTAITERVSVTDEKKNTAGGGETKGSEVSASNA